MDEFLPPMKPLHTSKNIGMGYSAACPTGRERVNYGKMCECALPEYLAVDLRAYKEGCERGSSLLDCLWGELYGSINIAEINDNAITHAQAQYLRDKYLFGRSSDD